MASKELSPDSEEKLSLPYRYAKEHQVIIEEESNHIKIQSVSSTPIETFSELRNYFKKPLVVEWLNPKDLERKLSIQYSDSAASSSELVEGMDVNYDLSALAENLPKTEDLLDTDNDAPVIRLINAILAEAIKSNTSDIFSVFYLIYTIVF